MQTILRDLGTVTGVQGGVIVRGDEVLASSFGEGHAKSQSASIELLREVADGLEIVDRRFEELLLEFESSSLLVMRIDDGFSIALLTSADANTPVLRVLAESAVRQVRRMADLPPLDVPVPVPARPEPKPEPPAPEPPPAPKAVAPEPKPVVEEAPRKKPGPPPLPSPPPKPAPAKPEPPKPEPKPEPKPAAPPKVAERDADPLLPKVLELLLEGIGPVARVTFKRGVAQWKESHAPTVGNLGALADILAADLSTDKERKAFRAAVDRLAKG